MINGRRTALAVLTGLAVLGAGATEASAAYRDTVLNTPGLVSHWRLGEASGTTAVDAKGLQNATLSGALDYAQPGALDNDANTSINFNAQNEALTAPDRAEYDLSAFTVEFWVRLNSFGDTTVSRVLAAKGAPNVDRNWRISLEPGTQGQILYSYGGTNGVNPHGYSAASLALNRWYHVAVVRDATAGQLRLYLDGALDSQVTATSTPVNSTDSVGLGGANGNWSNARYDEHAIYNRALTGSELLQHYRAGVDGVAPNTTITSSPVSGTSSTSASFSFTSTETPSTFECKLDAGAFGSCTSPKAYTALTTGTHTFSVRATDQAGNVDTTPATHTWTIAAPCTPAFGSFSPGTWPPGCWRPFADTSPFNRPLPTSPQLVSNSAAIVSRIVGDISTYDFPQNVMAKDDGSYGEPTYYSRSTDPLFTIHCTEQWGTCAIEGMQVRIPAGAVVEGGSASNGDRHMTIVDQSSGWEYDFWVVQTSPIPSTGGTLNIAWGGRELVQTGDGLGSDATAARYASLAGRLRVEELQAGAINHALMVVIDCDSKTFVYPALKTGRPCDAIGKSLTNAPPMGTRLQLNMTDAEIDNIKIAGTTQTIPAWRKTIYKAMARYGMIFGDTGTGNLFTIEQESGNQYSSLGYTDKWKSFAVSSAWDRSADNDGYIGFMRYDDVPWSTRLRVIAPCVSEGTC